MARRRRPLFILDENFPQPILNEALRRRELELDIQPVREFEPRFVEEDTPDHILIQGIWQRGAEGLITCDDNMLDLPEVVMMIQQTRFSVVTVMRLGDDGVAASGLVLAYLARIAHQHDARRSQVWRLSAPLRQPDSARALADAIRARRGPDPNDYRLTYEQLKTRV